MPRDNDEVIADSEDEGDSFFLSTACLSSVPRESDSSEILSVLPRTTRQVAQESIQTATFNSIHQTAIEEDISTVSAFTLSKPHPAPETYSNISTFSPGSSKRVIKPRPKPRPAHKGIPGYIEPATSSIASPELSLPALAIAGPSSINDSSTSLDGLSLADRTKMRSRISTADGSSKPTPLPRKEAGSSNLKRLKRSKKTKTKSKKSVPDPDVIEISSGESDFFPHSKTTSKTKATPHSRIPHPEPEPPEPEPEPEPQPQPQPQPLSLALPESQTVPLPMTHYNGDKTESRSVKKSSTAHRKRGRMVLSDKDESGDDDDEGVSGRAPLSNRARTKSTPMSELIRRVNSLPGSPFRSLTPSAPAYSPLLKSSRSMLSRIAPLHPTRKPPPPPPPPVPKAKERKTKKMLEMEEKWEEELSESVDGWACLEESERDSLRRRKKELELGGYDD